LVRRLCLTLSALALLSLAVPAAASAHAVLEQTMPRQGATVKQQPSSVAFYFDESVEASFGAVKVFNSSGNEVQAGEVVRPNGRSDGVATKLEPNLPDGTYTATYHVISADSHPVSGGFVFSIGHPSAGGGESVSSVLDREQAGRLTSTAFWLDRFLGYLAIALGVGGLVFLLAVWRRAARAFSPGHPATTAFSKQVRRLLGVAVVLGIATSLLALPLQVATAAGTTFWKGLQPDLLNEVLHTRFGTLMAIRAGAWVVLGGAVVAAARSGPGTQPRSARVALAGIAAFALVLNPALAGHATTQGAEILVLPAAVVHVTAMSIWLGGLALLVFALPRATGALEPADRGGLLLAALVGFSPIALGAVIALAATGVIQAIAEVGRVSALWDTGFGRMVLAKISLLTVLVGLGYANRQRLIPALGRAVERGSTPGAVGVWLRRNLRLEVGLIGVVLAVTAVLVSYAPSSETANGPVSGRTTIGSQVLEYTVDPATVGADQIHLYLFNAGDGSQYTGAKEVTAQLEQSDRGIGPLDVDLHKAGPGHYTTSSATFGAPGEWTVSVSVRTSAFDEDTVQIGVEIR
jgi:copper transport protein